MQTKQIIAWLIYLVAWFAYAVSFMSPVGMVFGALLVPYVLVVVIELVLGVGFLATIILMGVLWFLVSIGLGLRFDTWRALFLSVVPGSWAALILAVSLITRTGLGEGFELGVIFLAIASLIWLAGLACGVLMRKLVFRRSQSSP